MLAFLQAICARLEAANIPYMLSGSLALNLYTVPRMTRDIDMVIALKPENTAAFLALFSESQTYISPPAVWEAVRHQHMFNIIDFQTGYKLDFIVLKSEPFRQHEFARRMRSEALGFPVWVVQAEDLILSKLIWIQELMSDRQTEDLKHLLAIESLDQTYIQSWVEALKLQTFGLLNDV